MRLLQLLQLKSKVLLIKDICAIKNYCIEKIYNSNRVIYCNKCNTELYSTFLLFPMYDHSSDKLLQCATNWPFRLLFYFPKIHCEKNQRCIYPA